MTASVTFDTTVTATGNNTGIVVPDEVIEQLGAGRRSAVVVNVNGYGKTGKTSRARAHPGALERTLHTL